MGELLLHVSFNEGDGGWVTAQIVEVPAAISQGRTREEAKANVLDALSELAAHHGDEAGGRDIETLAVVPARSAEISSVIFAGTAAR